VGGELRETEDGISTPLLIGTVNKWQVPSRRLEALSADHPPLAQMTGVPTG
jgi:hypothetical protein